MFGKETTMRRGARSPVRRGPGLLGTVARTAVIAGTATAVSNSVSGAMSASAQQRAAHEQQKIDAAVQQALAQEQARAVAQAQPVPARADAGDSRITKLQQLAELKRQGILSEEEFAAEKERILAS